VFFTATAMENAANLHPSRVEYFHAHGPTIVQKVLVAIGKRIFKLNSVFVSNPCNFYLYLTRIPRSSFTLSTFRRSAVNFEQVLYC
jgi:hypothetical protein